MPNETGGVLGVFVKLSGDLYMAISPAPEPLDRGCIVSGEFDGFDDSSATDHGRFRGGFIVRGQQLLLAVLPEEVEYPSISIEVL